MPEEVKPLQPQVAPAKSMSLKRIIIGVVAGLVVLGAIAGAYYYYLMQQSNSPYSTNNTYKSASKSASKSATATSSANLNQTTDWKTYQDKNGKFLFKYPPTWICSESGSEGVDGSGGTTRTVGCSDTSKDQTKLLLGVDIYTLPKNASESLTSYTNINQVAVGGSKTFTDNELQNTYTRKVNAVIEGLDSLRYSRSYKSYNGATLLYSSESEGAVLKKTYSSTKVFYYLDVTGGVSEGARTTLLDQLISTFKLL